MKKQFFNEEIIRYFRRNIDILFKNNKELTSVKLLPSNRLGELADDENIYPQLKLSKEVIEWLKDKDDLLNFDGKCFYGEAFEGRKCFFYFCFTNKNAAILFKSTFQ